ncbi:MAG: methylmalonyl-CoA mutase family protein [Myxococcota bacterium]
MESVSVEQWKAQVLRELRGRTFETLQVRLPGDVTVEPLYTEPRSSRSAPGLPPYTRGGRAVGGWAICPRLDDPRLDVLNRSLRAEIAGGAQGAWVQLDLCGRLGQDPATYPEKIGREGAPMYSMRHFRTVFEGVPLSDLHLRLDAGANGLAPALMLMRIAEARGESLEQAPIRFCLDPSGALARDGRLMGDLNDVWSQALALVDMCVARFKNARALTVSTGPFVDAGADVPLELGIALAGVLEILETAASHQRPMAALAAQIELSIPMGRDLFLNIAKLRALRTLWSHLLASVGVDAPPDIHAFGSHRPLTRWDPWTNLLRTTQQTFAAIVGGADRITTAAYDEIAGQPEPLGRRIARNTQLISGEESHLGSVLDPAGGSYYIEALTDRLTEQGWARFQQIYNQGGLIVTLRSGWMYEELGQCWKTLSQDIAHRRRPITGISAYPQLDTPPPTRFTALSDAQRAAAIPGPEEPSQDQLLTLCVPWTQRTRLEALALPRHREAQGFEQLRDRAAAAATPPTIFLANLGTRAQWTPRAAFAANLFAAGGVAAIEDEGTGDQHPHDAAQALAARMAASGAKAVCICGPDDLYQEMVPLLIPALTAHAPGAAIYLAGKPHDAMRRAGVTKFIFLGCDALTTLTALLRTLSL